ncbi:unnamed protein product [Linum trigynum]|uniref:hAT-like transposase RNase-H fold domain-containing protein n=1 Tax=Linum trigynum TaxID=586398 RepID=A0AAV2FTX0_9ROSI
MATKMKQKYDKYWGAVDKMNKLLYIAAVLDPRLKLQFIGFTLKWMYDDEKAVSALTEDVELATYELYAHYENQMEVGEGSSSSQTELDDDGGNVDLVAEYMKQLQKERGLAPSRLLEEDSVEIDNIDEELSMVMKAIGISDVPLPHINTPRMCPNVEASTNTKGSIRT